jgi:hypothetical protein
MCGVLDLEGLIGVGDVGFALVKGFFDQPVCAPSRVASSSSCCADTPTSLPDAGPTRADDQPDRRPRRRSRLWRYRWPARISAGDTDAAINTTAMTNQIMLRRSPGDNP